jgi:hypothetical protein
MFGTGTVHFGVTPQPSGTCSYFVVHLAFDATTPKGKTMLAILMTAKAMGRTIDIWYDDSPMAANETNGCKKTMVSDTIDSETMGSERLICRSEYTGVMRR